MIAIAAVDDNWAIGYENRLLLSIPDDMKFFREKTMEKTVIMGRKTLESFPGKKPLKNRTNIVLTRDDHYEAEGAVIVHSKEELIERIGNLPEDEVFVIGGASIYQMLVPFCSKCYITKMYKEFKADAYFPNLDALDKWRIAERSARQRYEDLEYEFLTYVQHEQR